MATMHVTVGSFAHTELKAIRSTSDHFALLHRQLCLDGNDAALFSDPDETGRARDRDDQHMADADGASVGRAADEPQTTAGTAMTTQFSGIEETDSTKTAINLATANMAYQAALRTTASIDQVSLLDFLR
jgi:flagellin-like hook-associated protein FlgL